MSGCDRERADGSAIHIDVGGESSQVFGHNKAKQVVGHMGGNHGVDRERLGIADGQIRTGLSFLWLFIGEGF